MRYAQPDRPSAPEVRMTDDGKHGGNPAPIKPWTPPPTPPSPDGSGGGGSYLGG